MTMGSSCAVAREEMIPAQRERIARQLDELLGCDGITLREEILMSEGEIILKMKVKVNY